MKIIISCFLLLCSISVTENVFSDELSKLLDSGKTETQIQADKVINIRSSAQNDKDILKRIREIYSELEGLNTISVDVRKGIVTLSGEMKVSSDVSKAVQIAKQVNGVVEVKNSLTVNQKLSSRLETTYEHLLILGNRLVASLPLIILSITIFVLFWFIGSWLAKRQKLFRRFSPNYFIATLFGQITHLFIVVFGLILTLILLDATSFLSTILGAAGIFSLAIGFAVRDTVENYIASILLSIKNPFEVNDLIKIDQYEGNVSRLTSRATILISPDGNHIRIPNSMVYKSIITNYTHNLERRFQFDVVVDKKHDLLKVEALILHALKKTEGLCDNPKPLTIVHELGDSKAVLKIFAWLNQNKFDYLKTRSNAIINVKQALDSAGILIPESANNLCIDDKSKTVKKDQSNHNKTTKPDRTISELEISDLRDLSVDRTVENKVLEEQAFQHDANLLSNESPKEF